MPTVRESIAQQFKHANQTQQKSLAYLMKKNAQQVKMVGLRLAMNNNQEKSKVSAVAASSLLQTANSPFTIKLNASSCTPKLTKS